MGDWRSVRWQLPLSRPPTIVQSGLGIHGRAAGPSFETYRLPDLWCLHFYRYEGEVEVGGIRFPIQPGHASIIPANTPMIYRYKGTSEHAYFHFRPGEGPSTPIPAMQPLGRRFAAIDERISEAALTPSYPDERRQAVLWAALWELTESDSIQRGSEIRSIHPAVERSLREIERRLGEPLSVAALAEQAGVSSSYLSRLFQGAVGDSVIGYIRRRRAERADHLLRFSTLSIKAIAVAVGVPELQNFNRLIHQTRGVSPRQLRRDLVPPLMIPNADV